MPWKWPSILRRLSATRIAVLSALLLITGANFAWFYATASIESFDSLVYCKCGYSTVRFHEGRITMVEYHHDSVKPGQQIGTYCVRGNQVDLEITFHGKSRKDTLAIDNIGILAPDPVSELTRYYARRLNCPKLRIQKEMERLRSWFRAWTW